MHAEINLLRMNLLSVWERESRATACDRVGLDWLDQRVRLAIARVQLELAESELRRAQELFASSVVSAPFLETARSRRESLRADVEQRSRLVAEHEQQFERLRSSEYGGSSARENASKDSLRAGIRLLEKKLRVTEAQLKPINLTGATPLTPAGFPPSAPRNAPETANRLAQASP
jgi:multidrug resistance efflux pump